MALTPMMPGRASGINLHASAMPSPPVDGIQVFGIHHEENPDLVREVLRCRPVSFSAIVALCDSISNFEKKSQPQVCYKYPKQQCQHVALLAERGTNYNEPLTPMQVAERRARRNTRRPLNATVVAHASCCPVCIENHGVCNIGHSGIESVFVRAETTCFQRHDSSDNCPNTSHTADSVTSNDQESKDVKVGCCVCFDDLQEIFCSNRHLMATFCGHIFCNSCLNVVMKTNPLCPVCRKKIVKKAVHRIYL